MQTRANWTVEEKKELIKLIEEMDNYKIIRLMLGIAKGVAKPQDKLSQ